MIKVSCLLNNSDLAVTISLTVAIISLFWRHSQDILPGCSGRCAKGGVDHIHIESLHSYVLVITTFLISIYWVTWNCYLCGFPTLAYPPYALA